MVVASVAFFLICNCCLVVLSKSKLNTNGITYYETDGQYFSPPIVDYTCEKDYYNHRDVIKLPKIQISEEELESFESEDEMYVVYYNQYAPRWPKEKIGLFPLALSYTLLSKVDNVEIRYDEILTLLSNVYSDGKWGTLDLYDSIPQEEFHKTLPEALDFFIPLIEYFVKNSMKAKMEVAEYYAGT